MRLARYLTLPSILILTTSLVACNDDTTGTDEVGPGTESTDSTGESTSESESSDASTDSTDASTDGSTDSTDGSTDSSTDSTDSTDSTETTGGGVCDAIDVVDVDITLALIGSQAPPNGCSDHVFTGTLQGGGGGNWTLDACPCGAQCLIPDPYSLSIVSPNAATLPNMPNCPMIEMRRNAACEVVSITIKDLGQNEAAVWIGSRENADPGNAPDVDVNDELFAVCDCPDCDPPTLYQLGFETQGESLILDEGQDGVVGDWAAYSLSSHTYEVAGTSHFAWIMKR